MNEEQLLELYRKFEHLKNCTKKQEKIDCLTEYQHDTLFIYVLEFLINPHKKTGISDSKLKKDLLDKEGEEFGCFKQLIEYILANPTGRDNVVRAAQLFISKMPNFTLQTFIGNIITKKYKCGVAQKLVAEILPNVIQLDHQVMLAKKFEGELKEKVQMSLKLDGIRCTFIINRDGSMVAYSRQGKKIEGLRQIQVSLSNMMLKGYMLDGELIRINTDNLSSEENFKLTTSIVNSKENVKNGLEFVVFDIMPIEDYLKQECNLIYKDRLNLLIQKVGMGNTFVHIVPFLGSTDDPQVVYNKLERVLNENCEGLMLNTFTGLYKFGKRSSDVLKVKGSYTCDLKCIAIEEGDGKFKGTLGKLVVDYKGFEVRVGSGLTDEDRNNIWNNPESAIGHIIEVKYMQESQDEDGNLSLRHPVFVRIRDDKDDINYE